MVVINYPDRDTMYASIQQTPVVTGDLFELAVKDVSKITEVCPLPSTVVVDGNNPLAELVIKLLQWSTFMTILHQ